jgi:hypothetical protein
MDLERIKQNLRLRSGRSKKTRKPPSAIQSGSVLGSAAKTQNGVPDGQVQEPVQPANTNGTAVNGVAAATKADQPTTGGIEKPAYRPDLPHASTASNVKDTSNTSNATYGRSGIERPRQGPSKQPNFPRTMSENDSGGGHAGQLNEDSSSGLDFDLRPPAPRPRPPSTESLSEALFSSGHLNVLLRESAYLARFTAFLTKYRPKYHPALLHYLETQKAIKAVEYANAIAEGMSLSTEKDAEPSAMPRASKAAVLDEGFLRSSDAA